MATTSLVTSDQPPKHSCEKDSIDEQQTDDRQRNCQSKSFSYNSLPQDLSSFSTLTKTFGSPFSINTLPVGHVAKIIPRPQSPNYSRQKPIRGNDPESFSLLEYKQIQQISNGRDAFVVAISGPSSAGKSTLAILLHEIFKSSHIGNEVHNIITQDSYFLDKAYCPRTSFMSTPNKTENDFICATISKGAAPVYCTFRYFPSFSNHRNQDRFRISCPNTDVDGAIDFKSLSRDLDNLVSKGWLPDNEKKVDPILISRLSQEYEQLIKKMKKRVAKFFWKMVGLNAKHEYRGYLFVDSRAKNHQASGANVLYTMENRGIGELFAHRIIFVEGFLLYPQPFSSRNGLDNHNVDNHNGKAEILGSGESVCKCREGKMVIPAQSEFEIANLLEKDGLQKYFNAKLFLRENKAEVKARRFNRPEYIDNHISGSGRPLGKMWRCEGYFDDVAWKEYELAHRWLLDRGSPVPQEEDESILEPLGRDIRIELNTRRPIIVRNEDSRDSEGGVEGAVLWGVDMILGEMEKLEDAKRQYWLESGYS